MVEEPKIDSTTIAPLTIVTTTPQQQAPPQPAQPEPPQQPLHLPSLNAHDALGEIAREIGNQALDMLDAMFKSEHVQERLKQSMTPIVQSLVEAAATHDAEIRGHFNKIMKPYSDQYMFVLYTGGGMAISVIVLLLVTVIMLFSVRVRVSHR